MTEQDDDGELEWKDPRTGQILSEAVLHVAREAILLQQFEEVSRDRFGDAWPYGSFESFKQQADLVGEHLGGPPENYIVREGLKPPPSDNYPFAALHEMLDVYRRARKSVVRAHLTQFGSALLEGDPSAVLEKSSLHHSDVLIARTKSVFWEHAETAYIRLYSFWDRMGQVLDFAFFNIRKFDHNGFNSVMDRIHANAVPMNKELSENPSWKALRKFQNSTKVDGLKWLLERRNIIVHSLHLHPIEDDEESLLEAQYNHLEHSHRERRRPQKPWDELNILTGHLQMATSLVPACFSVIRCSPERKVKRFIS